MINGVEVERKRSFRAVAGSGGSRIRSESVASRAIREAQELGYLIGRRVRIGRVKGIVIGYNIAGRGRFCGARFPLLVQTAYGIAKCSLAEMELA